jgi:hypothetical protein
MLCIWRWPGYTIGMWFLGKKSNQQSTKLNLPPELRTFYGSQISRSLQLRRLAALLILVVIIAAAVLAGLWLHGLSTGQPKVVTKQSAPKTTQSIAVQTTPKSSSTVTQPASTGTMPNTGPGTDIFLIAFGSGLTAAAAYHLRLRRVTRLPAKTLKS